MALNIQKLLPQTLKIIIPLFFGLMCYYHISTIMAGAGDEILFLHDLNYIRSHGWVSAIAKNIGVTYLLIAYPFTYIFSDYVALRFTNVLLLALLVLYFYKIGEVKNRMFGFYLMFICGFGFFLSGTNDTLFIVAMLIFFNEVYKLIQDKEKASIPLLWSSLFVAFFTRELIYVYIPLIILCLFLVKKKTNLLHQWYISASVLVFLLVINIPCIEQNHHFSYDDKKPDSSVKSTWAQRQYLAQLLVNEGKIPNQTHPSWEETDAYLKLHGENSLPRTTGEGIFFDLKLTFLEFFKDFTSTVFLSIRQTAMMYIIVISYLVYALFRRRKITTDLLLPFACLYIVATFSFIIISFVEPRWLLVAYILAILYYSDLEFEKKLPKIVLQFNHLVLLLTILYGSYKVMLKL